MLVCVPSENIEPKSIQRRISLAPHNSNITVKMPLTRPEHNRSNIINGVFPYVRMAFGLCRKYCSIVDICRLTILINCIYGNLFRKQSPVRKTRSHISKPEHKLREKSHSIYAMERNDRHTYTYMNGSVFYAAHFLCLHA